MKRFKSNILTAITLGIVVAFSSCSKDDGAIPKRIGIEDVPVITTNLETGGTTATITFTNQAAFSGKFRVALYFPDAVPPTKVDMVVRKNGQAASVKVYKAGITSFPTSFTITAAEISALFGTPLALNDNYDFGPDIYVGSKKYEAFPASSLGNGQGVSGMSGIGFGEFVRFGVR